MFKRIFRYFEPAWTGNDNKVSLRSMLAIAFSIDFIRNLSHAIWKWDGGRSLEGLSLTLGIEAGLIVGLLGLTTYQNLQTFGKGDGTYYQKTIETEIKSDAVQKTEGKPDAVETTQ
jgi:hypothetical protein